MRIEYYEGIWKIFHNKFHLVVLYIHNEVLQELQKLITAFRYHVIFLAHLAFKIISWPYNTKESILLQTLWTPIPIS